jgi:hypothetical protein
MKRLALVATYLLIICAATSLAGAQNWQPGMPGPGFGGPPGVGIPGLGGPPGAGIPGLGAPFGGPDCGASMCQPMPPCLKPPILFSSYAAGQVNQDIGKIKFSTQASGLPLNGAETLGTYVSFSVNGVWVGSAARIPLGDSVYARAEGRFLIPSTENANSVTQLCAAPPVSRDWNSCTKYRWGLIDGALGCSCTPWLSVMGGVRWDSLYLFMTNPTVVPGFSTTADESDLTLSSIQPYLGFEAAWVGSRCILALKGIGSPWASTRTIFGMTFGDPAGIFAPTRESTDTVSKRAAFQELTLQVTLPMSGLFNVGAFATVNSLWAHSEGDFTTAQVSTAQVAGQNLTGSFDIDLNRTVYMIGGSVTAAFGPFM